MKPPTAVAPILSVLALAASACSQATASGPYPARIPDRQVFLGNVRTAAFVPLYLSDDSPEADALSARIGGAIAAKLQPFGIRSIRASQWRGCWKKQVAKLGGLGNALLGGIDEGKHMTAWIGCAAEMRERFGADAILDFYVKPTMAVVEGDIARWHGAEEDLRSNKDRMSSGKTLSGEVRAVSLLVKMYDINGNVVFENAGGIELLAELAGEGRQEKLVPKKEILTDDARITRAVEIVFEPLLGGGP